MDRDEVYRRALKAAFAVTGVVWRGYSGAVHRGLRARMYRRSPI